MDFDYYEGKREEPRKISLDTSSNDETYEVTYKRLYGIWPPSATEAPDENEEGECQHCGGFWAHRKYCIATLPVLSSDVSPDTPLCGKIGYLAGPMTVTGREDFNYPEFKRVATRLREEGFDILNPADYYGGRTDLDRTAYFKIDFASLLVADYLVLMGGWESSHGANLEVDVALERGIPIYEFTWSRGLLLLPGDVEPRPPRGTGFYA